MTLHVELIRFHSLGINVFKATGVGDDYGARSVVLWRMSFNKVNVKWVEAVNLGVRKPSEIQIVAQATE